MSAPSDEAARAAVAGQLRALDAVDLDPPALLPARLYLELVGEALRARAFTLTDADGGELALRPDFTVPAARAALALDRWRGDGFWVRYDGVVFRRGEPEGGREFRQIGAERFTPQRRNPLADVETLACALDACRAAGVEPRLRIGHAGVFGALVHALGFPERWAERLKAAFPFPGAVAAALRQAEAPARETSALEAAFAALPAGVEAAMAAQILAAQGLTVLAGRPVADIAARMCDKARDASGGPPSAAAVTRLRAALQLAGPLKAVRAELADVASDPGFGAALDAVDALLDALGAAAPIPNAVNFAPGFGRGLAYYDGVLFELECPRTGASLGGGGRYDGLLEALARREGAAARAEPWGAVGFALRPARLAVAREAVA